MRIIVLLICLLSATPIFAQEVKAQFCPKPVTLMANPKNVSRMLPVTCKLMKDKDGNYYGIFSENGGAPYSLFKFNNTFDIISKIKIAESGSPVGFLLNGDQVILIMYGPGSTPGGASISAGPLDKSGKIKATPLFSGKPSGKYNILIPFIRYSPGNTTVCVMLEEYAMDQKPVHNAMVAYSFGADLKIISQGNIIPGDFEEVPGPKGFFEPNLNGYTNEPAHASFLDGAVTDQGTIYFCFAAQSSAKDSKAGKKDDYMKLVQITNSDVTVLDDVIKEKDVKYGKLAVSGEDCFLASLSGEDAKSSNALCLTKISNGAVAWQKFFNYDVSLAPDKNSEKLFDKDGDAKNMRLKSLQISDNGNLVANVENEYVEEKTSPNVTTESYVTNTDYVFTCSADGETASQFMFPKSQNCYFSDLVSNQLCVSGNHLVMIYNDKKENHGMSYDDRKSTHLHVIGEGFEITAMSNVGDGKVNISYLSPFGTTGLMNIQACKTGPNEYILFTADWKVSGLVETQTNLKLMRLTLNP